MAQWQALLRLDSGLQSRVSQLYEGPFSREVRHYMCHWIEKQDWDLAAVDENAAISCFHALLEYLDELWKRSVQENKILQGPNFLNMKDSLVNYYQTEPQNLARIVSHCLKEEKKILDLASKGQDCSNPSTEQNSRELDSKVSGLKQQTLDIKKEVKTLEDLNEQLDLIQKTWQSRVQQHNGLAQSRAAVEEGCFRRANFITHTKQIVLQQLMHILNQADQVVATLTDEELPKWKHRQQMACIGSPVDTCLDHLQKWFTTVAEVIVGIREQLQKVQDQNSKYNCTGASSLAASIIELEKFALSLLTKLLTNALVVEKQPVMQSLPQRPLILKTNVGFKVTVRYLANLPEFKFRLKVTPVFDKDVEEAKTVTGFRHFDFERDDKKVLDIEPPGVLMAEFRNMSLKERKVKTKASCEGPVSPAGAPGVLASTAAKSRPGVTEEFHIIKFVTELEHAGLKCNIEASSLPLVVISSTAQASSAWASVMWFNMLSTSGSMNLSLFVDPPPLTWDQLAQVLSWQFLSVGQRELDENQLSMLRDKIVDDPDGFVHWSKFSSKNESPWIWIDGILDLIKKHLVDLWRDGYIMGFVSRERTEFLLKTKKTGTFLLRFSETNKDGAISFSWVDHSNGEPHVHSVLPYKKKELESMSLPDQIYHYSLTRQKETRNPLCYLYPDIHKDAAFGRYYKNLEVPTPRININGYVNRKNASISVNPTPPPSPPRETCMMEVDTDMDEKDGHIQGSQVLPPLETTDPQQVMKDLFPDLVSSPGPDWLTSPYLHSYSPQANLSHALIVEDLWISGFSE